MRSLQYTTSDVKIDSLSSVYSKQPTIRAWEGKEKVFINYPYNIKSLHHNLGPFLLSGRIFRDCLNDCREAKVSFGLAAAWRNLSATTGHSISLLT